MRTLNIKDFSLADWQKVTSKFISDTFKNFLDNFMYLFDAFKRLNEKHIIYKDVSDRTMEFLYFEAQSNLDPLVVVGYQTPVDSSGVNIQQAYGTVSLEETLVENLIPCVPAF